MSTEKFTPNKKPHRKHRSMTPVDETSTFQKWRRERRPRLNYTDD
jgi:hypothetical protein